VVKKTLVHRATTILISPPVNIPIRDDLLHQPQIRIYHPQPQIFNLDTWLLSTEVSKQMSLIKKRHTQNYSSKFKKFNSWCKSMKIDPYSAFLKETADLLAFFLMKGCNTEQLQTIVQCYQFSFRRLIIFQ
jgi:hypothetical protein